MRGIIADQLTCGQYRNGQVSVLVFTKTDRCPFYDLQRSQFKAIQSADDALGGTARQANLGGRARRHGNLHRNLPALTPPGHRDLAIRRHGGGRQVVERVQEHRLDRQLAEGRRRRNRDGARRTRRLGEPDAREVLVRPARVASRAPCPIRAGRASLDAMQRIRRTRARHRTSANG